MFKKKIYRNIFVVYPVKSTPREPLINLIT